MKTYEVTDSLQDNNFLYVYPYNENTSDREFQNVSLKRIYFRKYKIIKIRTFKKNQVLHKKNQGCNQGKSITQ